MSVGDFDRKTIIINSQFRESGNTNQFVWRFQERIENIRHAELRYFVLENGVYNVDSFNNTFYLYEDYTAPTWSKITKVVIPVGIYDDITFSSTIGLCMTATSFSGGASNLYYVQINTQGQLSISAADSGADFGIAFTDGTPAGNYPETAVVMGFEYSPAQPAYTSIASGLYLTIIGQNATYLANFDYLLIQSQKLGNDISFYSAAALQANIGGDTPLRSSATSCYAFIPNITPTNNISSLIFNNQRPPQISTLKYPYSLDYVDISIVDKLGNLIDTRGNNVSLVIELYTDKQSQNVSTNAMNVFHW